MRKKLRSLLILAGTAMTAAVVIDQLRRPAVERDWHGVVLGVPYDLRRPTLQRVMQAVWNPQDPRLFTPRAFGIGWTVNLHRLLRIVRGETRREDQRAV